MRRTIVTSILAVVVFTVLLGGLYPFAVWGIGQVAFPGQANGSQIHRDGRLVGSRLIGQDFSQHPEDFQSRPSATGYSASATFFANHGPNQASTVVFYRRQLARYVARERRYVPGGLRAAHVPVDAVTASASGVDPHISTANALIQAHRVAAVRQLPLHRVRQLIDDHTDGRFAGLLGEPGVNVVELNIALDEASR